MKVVQLLVKQLLLQPVVMFINIFIVIIIIIIDIITFIGFLVILSKPSINYGGSMQAAKYYTSLQSNTCSFEL